jgi:surface protein
MYIRMVFKPTSKSSLQTAINEWIAGTITSSSNVTGTEYVHVSDTTYGSMNIWDVTAAGNDFSQLFKDKTTFNEDISSWNTSSVTNMNLMFYGASIFDQDIGSWNTAAVTNMSNMFRNATSFNQNIGNWNTAAATDMYGMFRGATAFNQNIGNWNTAAATDMYAMFRGATAFNQNIGNWNTAKVTDMSAMFYGATAFNQNIGNWNTAKVTDMSQMFQNAKAFNQDIGNWNTAKVTDMYGMFEGASAFDQNIRGWNTAAATDIRFMFEGATAMQSTFSGVTGFGDTPTSAFFNQTLIKPQLSSSKPNDNATKVSVVSLIVLNFDRNIDVETGNITIRKTSDNSIIETINITISQVTGTGTNKITINPSKKLPFSTEMYVLIDSTCFDDVTSLSYPGISNTTTLSFTTAKKPSKKKQTDIIKQEAETISTDQGELTFTEVQEAIRKGKEPTMNGGLITIKAAIRYTSDNNEQQVLYITSQNNQLNYIYNEMVEAKQNGYLNSVLEYYINNYDGSNYYTNLINAFDNSLL